MLKRCSKCKLEKPDSEFWKSQCQCKDCIRAYKQTPDGRKKNCERRKAWYENPKNKKRAIVRSKMWRKENREKYREWQKGYSARVKEKHHEYGIGRRYGLSKEQYASLLKKQGGKCAVCGFVPEKRKLSVDHDHLSGKVRGLLCDGCNRSLGYLHDSIANTLRVAEYLCRYGSIEQYAEAGFDEINEAFCRMNELAANGWRRPA